MPALRIAEWFPRRAVIGSWMSVLLRWAWWNVFVLAGAAFLIGLALSNQGIELGLIAARQPWPDQLSLAALLWLVAMQFFLAGHVTARAAGIQIQFLSKSSGLPSSTVRLWVQQALPAAVGTGLGTILLTTVHESFVGWLWCAAWLLPTLGGMKLINRYARPTRVATAVLGRQVGAAGDLPAVMLALACIATPLLPQLWLDDGLVALSRQAGTLGITALGVGLWVLLLSLAFVALPLQANGISWALAAPVIWWAASHFSDPNLFPRNINTGALATKPLPQLRDVSRPTSVHHAVVRWLRQFENEPGDDPIPLILVSAEGGGIRAAYWTAEVLALLNMQTDGRLARHTIAYSGVSGGAFGITAFALATRQAGLSPGQMQQKLRALMADDYLAPLTGAMTVTEPLWQLAPLHWLLTPRDLLFERAWEASWKQHFDDDAFSRSFWKSFDINQSTPPVPMMVLNTTNVETGKRVIVGNIGLTTQRQDFFEFFNVPGVAEVAQDMRVSAAAHLSARFPYLSPPAAVQTATPTGATAGLPSVALRTWGHLVDGGYFDNSGVVVIQDIVQDLHDLWTDAHLGNEHATSIQELDWERDRRLLKRIRIMVLVLRNDPFQDESAERLDFPTIAPASPLATDSDALGAQYNSGQFLSWLPTINPMQEIWAPPVTMLAAREARGATSRRLLSTHITGLNFGQQVQCEIQDRSKRQVPLDLPIRYTAGCLNQSFTRYIEVSLADALELLHAPIPDGELPPAGDAFCPPWVARRDIALGWVLSPRSVQAMRCAAAASVQLRDVADWLDPAGAVSRRTVKPRPKA